jgi:hypothetical protein
VLSLPSGCDRLINMRDTNGGFVWRICIPDDWDVQLIRRIYYPGYNSLVSENLPLGLSDKNLTFMRTSEYEFE